jgi:oligopeptidase A
VRDVAQRFRETVLGLGGSLPAVEVYRLFRGRDATPDALLLDQGLLDA